MNRIQRLTFSVLAVSLVLTTTGSGQQPLERYAVELRESLQLVVDSDSVRVLVGNAPADSVEAALHEALHTLRLVELGAGPKQWQATTTRLFNRVADLSRERGWAEYGRAEILRANTERPRTFIMFSSIKGSLDARTRRTNLTKVLADNPRFEPALLALADLAIASNDDDQVAEALAAIDAAQLGDSRLARPAIELELARDSVAAANRRADLHAAAGTSLPELTYARAIAALRAGDAARGGALYQNAVDSNSPGVLRRIRRDVLALRKGGERLDNPADIVAFWDTHSASVGLTVDEKLVQHYRRLHVARTNYMRISKSKVPDRRAILLREDLDESPFDIRGTIYIRRGEAKEVLRSAGGASSEYWVYETLGGVEILHFMRSSEGPDWGLASAFSCADEDAIMRANYDSRIARSINTCRSGFAPNTQALLREALANAADAARLEAPDRDAHDLPFYYTLFNLRMSDTHRPEAVIVAGLPAGKLRADSTANGFTYRFAMTVTLVQYYGTARAQKDTVITIATKTRPHDDDLLRVFVQVPAFAGAGIRYVVRARDLNAPASSHTYGGTTEFLPYSEPRLALSDVVLTRPGESAGGFPRGRYMLDVLPFYRFERGEMGVYFEMYNAKPDTDYRLSVRVVKKDGKRNKNAIQVAFTERTDTATPDWLQVFKVVNLELPRGRYRLEVRVDGGGQSAVRERLFEIP